MKRFVCLLLTLIVLASALSLNMYAASSVVAKKIADEDELSWILYTNGELYIYGDCAIPNYTADQADWSYYNDKVTSVIIEDGITAIGKNAFYGMKKLKTVDIPSSVKTIGMRAFYKCIKLTEITLPKKVTAIPSEAFYGCTALTSVTFEGEVDSIRSGAFSGCASLEEITIPESVESIGAMAFKDCEALTSMYFEGDAPTLGEDAFDGVDEDEFTVYYISGASGFNKTSWNIYNTAKYNPKDGSISKDDDILYGDINRDGKITKSDRLILVGYLSGDPDYASYSKVEECDLDMDGKITVLDDIYLARKLDGWKDYD